MTINNLGVEISPLLTNFTVVDSGLICMPKIEGNKNITGIIL